MPHIQSTTRKTPSRRITQSAEQNTTGDDPIKLTPKEQEVLAWGALGKTSWEIATIMKCTESGINFHFTNIRIKFGVNTRTAALIKATLLGLVRPQ